MKAVMEDWRTAPVDERVRAVLGFLTRFVPADAEIGSEDIAELRRAGLSDRAIREAMYASWCFQNLSKWMDALDAPLPTDTDKPSAAKALWRSSYARASVPPPY